MYITSMNSKLNKSSSFSISTSAGFHDVSCRHSKPLRRFVEHGDVQMNPSNSVGAKHNPQFGCRVSGRDDDDSPLQCKVLAKCYSPR